MRSNWALNALHRDGCSKKPQSCELLNSAGLHESRRFCEQEFSLCTPHAQGGFEMKQTRKGLTRRRFLEGGGLAGGSAALYETMTALGLINLPEAWAGPPELPHGSGKGKSGVILGAGIGGLTAAFGLIRTKYHPPLNQVTQLAAAAH